ncbi:MAG TPA: hypothetical protein VIK12_02335 [Pengzhenrongella sp.]
MEAEQAPAVAREQYEHCPDVVEQGVGTLLPAPGRPIGRPRFALRRKGCGDDGPQARTLIVPGTSARTGGWGARCAIRPGSGCGPRRRRRARGEPAGRSPSAARPCRW